MLLRILSALVAAGGVGAWLAKRVAGARAQELLDEGLAQIEQTLVDNLGGAATVTVDGEPLPVLLGLQQEELPAGTIEMEHFRLPNGLAVRHATLSTDGGDDAGHLVARVSARAITDQLAMPGVQVQMQGGRLRLIVGVAAVRVRVKVVDGRVVLSIPVAPPPLGSIVSAGLTELVPHPPPGVELHDVAVEGRELVIRAIVDVERLAELARRHHTP